MSGKLLLIKNKSLKKPLMKKQIADSIILFKSFRKGDYIYPGMLIRNLYLDMNQAYALLDILESQGALNKCFEVTCPNESRTTGKIYNTLLDLVSADFINCPVCNCTIDVSENNIQIYEVIYELEVQYE